MMVMIITTFSVSAQQLVLKKLTPQEVQKLKKPFKPLPVVHLAPKKSKNTEVVKNYPGESSELVKKDNIESPNKGCIPLKVDYKIVPESLTPVNSNMGISLGNVYNINEFLSGKYSQISYTTLNSFIVKVGSIGGNSRSSELTEIPAGTTKSQFSIALDNFTDSLNDSILTQKNSAQLNITYATSEKKLKASLGLGYSDISDNNVSINSSISTETTKKNYTMMYKEENFSQEIEMDGKQLMESNQNFNDLVYVSKIIYGKLGFFNYQTESDLFKLDVESAASGNYSGMKFSINADLSMMNSSENGSITARLYGSKSDSEIPDNTEGFKRWVNENPSSEAMVPVGFVLRFVNDNALAYFITSGSDPVQVCMPQPEDDRFDVKIELLNINCKSVCELDGKEDLWGKQAITYATTTSKGKKKDLINDDAILWEKSESDSNNLSTDKKININAVENKKLVNLTREELENLEIWIGGKLYDYEKPPLSDVKSVSYTCLNCNQPQSNPIKRVFKIGKLNDRLVDPKNNSLRNLNLNEYVPLKVGNDYIMNLDYEEGSNICKSKISSNYQISVKKHY